MSFHRTAPSSAGSKGQEESSLYRAPAASGRISLTLVPLVRRACVRPPPASQRGKVHRPTLKAASKAFRRGIYRLPEIDSFFGL